MRWKTDIDSRLLKTMTPPIAMYINIPSWQINTKKTEVKPIKQTPLDTRHEHFDFIIEIAIDIAKISRHPDELYQQQKQ